MQALKSIFRLLKLCLSTKEGKVGIFFFIGIIVLNIFGIQLTLKLIYWNKDFYNALEKYDTAAVLTQVGIFVVLTALSAAQFLSANYLRGLLQIRWRKVLTEVSFNGWFQKKAYWHMDTSETATMDNPDQRVAEDCRIFVDKITSEALDLITRVIGLATYFVVLWQIASFPLSFSLFGYDVSISHYMVWAAPVYVLICSGMTHWLGAPLMKLGIEQQKREADFRFALTRFRESKEAIALQNGEQVERAALNSRFDHIIQNWRKLITRELILGCFTRPYMSTILRIPVFLALPVYLIGHVTLGSLMQISSAFQNVATSLSWFIFSYRDLAELAASSNRLERFLVHVDQVNLKSGDDGDLLEQSFDLKIDQLNLYTSDHKALMNISDVHIKPKGITVLKGASGIGKSTLIKTFAGLHQQFTGEFKLPVGNKMFLPQKVYFPLGGLADAVCYPQALNKDRLPEIEKILEKVGLRTVYIKEHLSQCNASQLSGGEQQRVIFARILYNKPSWVFMDEGTNALDEEAEKYLFTLLQQELPETTCVIVSHSESINHEANGYHQINLSYV